MKQFEILADENMLQVDALFEDLHGSPIPKVNGRELSSADLGETEILLVRSITKVNRELIEGSKVRFVGTATIGMDHVDRTFLTNNNIYFTNAPGCNAESVADYVIAAMLHCTQGSWQGKTAAIIGCGNVGGRVASRLTSIGLSVVINDPPQREAGLYPQRAYVSLEQALAADIICLHTPLITDGPHPTRNLITAEKVKAINPGAVIISAGRGGVINEAALIERMRSYGDLSLAIDVWAEEPSINQALVPLCKIATPHIAGHSLDGKVMGTWMLRKSVSEWADLEPPEPLVINDYQPEPISWDSTRSFEANCSRLVNQIYQIEQDHLRFVNMLNECDSDEAAAKGFDRLRKQYPVRREYSSLQVMGVPKEFQKIIAAIGFKII